MEQFHILSLLIGGLIVLLSFLAKKIQKGAVSEPLLAMLMGILCGPHILNWINTAQWTDQFQILHIASEATMAMALMATALRLPRDYVQKHWRTLLTLLAIVLTLMVLFAALSFWTILSISFLTAILLGAIVAPTDPVVAAAIISGPIARKFLPDHTRHTISMESGANDGLAMPFVMLPLLLLLHSPETAWSEWFLKVLLWENLGAIVIGAIAGAVSGKLIMLSYEKKELTTKAFLGSSIALSFAVLAGVELLNANGIVAVFAAGIGLNHMMDQKHELREERIQEVVERLFTIPIFFIFGLLIPWQDWLALGWTGIALPLLILLVRRIPAMFIARKGIKTLKDTPDIWFSGWFGPIGVAALYYAVLAHDHLHDPIYWTWPSLIVFSSTVIHGASSGSMIKWYSKAIDRVK